MKKIIALFHSKENRRIFIGDNNSALGVTKKIAAKLKQNFSEEEVGNAVNHEDGNAIIVGAGLGEDGAILQELEKLSVENITTVWGIHRRTDKWQQASKIKAALKNINYKYIPIYLFSQTQNIDLKRRNFILTEGIPHNRSEVQIQNTLKAAENLLLVDNKKINCVINLRGSVPEDKISNEVTAKIGFMIGTKILKMQNQTHREAEIFLELGGDFPIKFLERGVSASGYQGNIRNNKEYFAESGLNSLEVMEGMVNLYKNSLVVSSVASSSVVTEFADFVNKGKLYLVAPPYLGGNNLVYQKQLKYYLETGYAHGYLDCKAEEFIEINKHLKKKPLDNDIVADSVFASLN